MDQHFLHSSYREKLIEHLFVGELLKHSWLERGCSLEVSSPEVDNRGYDLVAEENGVIRHIQLKASHMGARAAGQKVHTALAAKPSGCIVWIYFDQETLKLGPFLYYAEHLAIRYRMSRHFPLQSTRRQMRRALRPSAQQFGTYGKGCLRNTKHTKRFMRFYSEPHDKPLSD